jgi:2-dehydro-3-deoxygalactonokinase
MAAAISPARHLLALDWGTSSLRAALMTADGAVLHQLSSADGILSVPERGFDAVLQRLCGGWLHEHPDTLVLAAGMIGSRQGWHEAPYLACPAGFAEMAAGVIWPEAGRRLGFVPGLQTDHAGGIPDVMRGEEVQIFGALNALGLDDGVFVLPGTHSKWVLVENRRVVRFYTFMTGESYALLRRYSILARTMPAEDRAGAGDWPVGREHFVDGCRTAADGALLHRLFSVRARALFGLLPAEAQPEYLSGLLIGEEIREALALLGGNAPDRVYLVCKPELLERYRCALDTFGLTGIAGADHATFKGLLAIARERAMVC